MSDDFTGALGPRSEFAFTAYDREAEVWRVTVATGIGMPGRLLTGEDGAPLSWERFVTALDAADAYNREHHPPVARWW